MGRSFAQLTVFHVVRERDLTFCWCECTCGEVVRVRGGNLGNGHTRSCGCRKIEALTNRRTHGRSGTPEYKAYMHARSRCENPNDPRYPEWGGRGIKFLFTSFEQWLAELGDRPSKRHSVDRWPNPAGHYEPGNVRWATPKDQADNRRPRRWWKRPVDNLPTSRIH